MKKYIVLMALPLCISCKKNAASDYACNPAISYSNTVKPVFINNCTASGCHDGVNYPSLAEYSVAHDAAGQIKDAVARNIMPGTAA